MANKFSKLEEKSNHYAVEIIDAIKLSGKPELAGVIGELWSLSDKELGVLIDVVKPKVEQSMMSYAQFSAGIVRELKEQERNPTQKVVVEAVVINLFTALLSALTTLDNKLARDLEIPSPLTIGGVKDTLLSIDNLLKEDKLETEEPKQDE